MSENNNLILLEDGKLTDITPIELEKIEKFKKDGLPGITVLNDIKMSKAIDLYLSGKTYTEVAKTIGVERELVLYMGQKFNWYATKMEHLQILDKTLKERILHAKLVNQDFVLQIQQFFLHKIGQKMTRFIATNDYDVANEIDGKDLDRYYKAVELIDKLTSDRAPSKDRAPAVGLNLGDGVTVTKTGENEVTITPKERTSGEMLNYLANLKREEDKQSGNMAYDIKQEDINKQSKE